MHRPNHLPLPGTLPWHEGRIPPVESWLTFPIRTSTIGRSTARVLVTGATGFIGSHVVERLLAQGDEVRCLTRSGQPGPWLAGHDVELFEGSVTDSDRLGTAVAGCDQVIHLAGATLALNSDAFVKTNANGVRNIAAACAAQQNPPALVVVSSLAAAGPAPAGRPRVETDRPHPVSNYGRSKLAGEREAAAFAGRVPISIVRPPIVVGQRDRLSFAMFRPIWRFGVHVVPGFAARRFSLIHADDLADALLRVAERGTRLASPAEGDGDAAGIYYAAAPEQPTYAELGQMLATALDRTRARCVRLPEPVVWATGGMANLSARLLRKPLPLSLDKVREAVAGDWTCSAQRLHDELAFTPAASLADRLRQTAVWYREAGWL